MNTDEHGSSLIEVMGLLAIAGMIAVSLMGGISLITARVKITQAQNQITRIVKSMTTQFASDIPSMAADKSAKMLFEAGVHQSSDVVADSGSYTGTNVYGSAMTIQGGPADSDGNPYFTLTYEDLPATVCSDLLQANFGDDPSSGLKSVSVFNSDKNASTVFEWDKPEADTHPAHKLIPDAGESFDACSSKKNNITWTFYL